MFMYNVQGFCNNGKYIPFWINETDFVLLFYYGMIVLPCVYEEPPLYFKISTLTLKNLFLKETSNWIKEPITFCDDTLFLTQLPWVRIKKKLPKNRKCCLYNLTKGIVVVIDNEKDCETLVKMVSCKKFYLIEKIVQLIATTMFIRKMYYKYLQN